MVDGQRGKSNVGGRRSVDFVWRVFQCLTRLVGGEMGVYKVFGSGGCAGGWLGVVEVTRGPGERCRHRLLVCVRVRGHRFVQRVAKLS